MIKVCPKCASEVTLEPESIDEWFEMSLNGVTLDLNMFTDDAGKLRIVGYRVQNGETDVSQEMVRLEATDVAWELLYALSEAKPCAPLLPQVEFGF